MTKIENFIYNIGYTFIHIYTLVIYKLHRNHTKHPPKWEPKPRPSQRNRNCRDKFVCTTLDEVNTKNFQIRISIGLQI